MNVFFGSISHLFAAANKVHWIWCAVILLVMLILADVGLKLTDARLKKVDGLILQVGIIFQPFDILIFVG